MSVNLDFVKIKLVAKDFTNREVAHLLRSVAAAYIAKDKDQFRIMAYQRAADSVDRASSELKDIWDDGKLDDVPGIGSSIASYLDELFRRGEVKHFNQVMKGLPEAMFELLNVPGIGAKTAYKLSSALKLKNPETAILDLEKAAKAGKVKGIEGFGEEKEKDILRGIQEFKGRSGRLLLPYATLIAKNILSWLRQSKDVLQAYPLGSLRRQVSTIGDIDIAVATNHPKKVIKHFISYPKKDRVLEAGETTASIRLKGGEQIDLMVQPEASFGALLQHFTGSKQHNIALRELALKKGLSLSEYGIKKGRKLTVYASEEDFYHALGMEWIPPELREDTGEIEVSLKKQLPHLVEPGDIKGDLHVHSSFPIETSHDEGADSIEDILEEGSRLGYEYIGFSEHNPSVSKHQSSKIIDIIKRKKAQIDKINYSHEKSEGVRVNKLPIHALNGLEIDIKPNGELGIPEKSLDFLDYAIVSIHSSFRMNKDEMTKRVLSALTHPKVKILGHPTGRKINSREAIEINWEKIFEFCLKKNIWLEINAWPDRLDLPDNLVREAVKIGVKMVICTDAHASEHLDLMCYGVSVARRGWAEKGDIVNTLGYNDFLKELKS